MDLRALARLASICAWVAIGVGSGCSRRVRGKQPSPSNRRSRRDWGAHRIGKNPGKTFADELVDRVVAASAPGMSGSWLAGGDFTGPIPDSWLSPPDRGVDDSIRGEIARRTRGPGSTVSDHESPIAYLAASVTRIGLTSGKRRDRGPRKWRPIRADRSGDDDRPHAESLGRCPPLDGPPKVPGPSHRRASPRLRRAPGGPLPDAAGLTIRPVSSANSSGATRRSSRRVGSPRPVSARGWRSCPVTRSSIAR